ncbi:MAG: chemotaxis response regulator protein-glutamate methylesterase [Chlorobi bacterium]|nr:chemotaxis response regulator protein-glutamate methylesterase [Chlorobiota bacterium]
MQDKIKVIIIDKSASVREILLRGLKDDPSFDVLGVAQDVHSGKEMIIKEKPDVILLDIEMPKMDGIEFLRRIMSQVPIPTVVLSSMTQKGKLITIQAFEAGAVDFVPKQTTNITHSLELIMNEIRTKLKTASTANLSSLGKASFSGRPQDSHPSPDLSKYSDKVIAIGASTGGTIALKKVITNLPTDCPAVLVVHNLPAGYTKTFADRLNEMSKIQVKEAESGDRIIAGRVLIAPGDYHMKVNPAEGGFEVNCETGERVNGQRPSIDVMMFSVAEYIAENAFGMILTGIGNDGAQGLKAMKNSGAKTLGQDESSCVIYGTPKVAYEIEAVDRQCNLNSMAEELIQMITD